MNGDAADEKSRAVLELEGAASTKSPVSASIRLQRSEDAEAAADAASEATDEAAFRQLYEAHAAALTRRLFHAAGDAELARDLTQEAFATAFAKLGRFRGEAQLSTWLYAIAFNHLRDHRKRTRRRTSWWARLRREPTGEPSRPDEAVEQRDDLHRLRAAVSGLPDALRDAYVLRVVEQLSLREAAQILGAREATVSYRAKKAEALVRGGGAVAVAVLDLCGGARRPRGGASDPGASWPARGVRGRGDDREPGRVRPRGPE
jgi:RNA polymerase sigma-70 factor (ECF subfamily)